MAEITTRKRSFVENLIEFLKFYMVFALLILFGTLPTKVIYLLVTWLWSLL